MLRNKKRKVMPETQNGNKGTSLVVQWLRLHTSTAGDMGSIPGRGTKIPHGAQGSQKKKNGNKEWLLGRQKRPRNEENGEYTFLQHMDNISAVPSGSNTHTSTEISKFPSTLYWSPEKSSKLIYRMMIPSVQLN